MFLKKTISFFIVLSLLLLTSCSLLLQGENKTDTAASGKKNTIDDIPLTSTVPPYSKSFVQPGHEYDVECFIFDYNEALEMYNRLRENGIDFYDNYALFNYQDEEVFTGYKFYGVMTKECALSCQGKEFYELEFEKNKVGIMCCLYYKDKYEVSNLDIDGTSKFPYEAVCRIYLLHYFPHENLNSIDVDKLILVDANDDVIFDIGTPYSYYAEYEGTPVLSIESEVSITFQFFEKVKGHIVFLLNRGVLK